jgi:hypothetical protein
MYLQGDGISLSLFSRQDKAEEQQWPVQSPAALSTQVSPAVLVVYV